MNILRLAEGVSAEELTTPYTVIPSSRERDELTVQVNISDTAKVTIQGRIDPRLPFVDIETVEASAIVPIAKVKHLRIAIDDNTGKVSASVLY